jgi:hypothetical protein
MMIGFNIFKFFALGASLILIKFLPSKNIPCIQVQEGQYLGVVYVIFFHNHKDKGKEKLTCHL